MKYLRVTQSRIELNPFSHNRRPWEWAGRIGEFVSLTVTSDEKPNMVELRFSTRTGRPIRRVFPANILEEADEDDLRVQEITDDLMR